MASAVRGCLELRMQLYNTKIHLPQGKGSCFSHVDCEWLRRGVLDTPAPQCGEQHRKTSRVVVAAGSEVSGAAE